MDFTECILLLDRKLYIRKANNMTTRSDADHNMLTKNRIETSTTINTKQKNLDRKNAGAA